MDSFDGFPLVDRTFNGQQPKLLFQSEPLNKDSDLEEELLSQYNKIVQLQDDVKDNDDIPANQRAQVMNSAVSALAQIIKLRQDLKRETTLQLMEQALLEAIDTLDKPARDVFFEEYERLAASKGLV